MTVLWEMNNEALLLRVEITVEGKRRGRRPIKKKKMIGSI